MTKQYQAAWVTFPGIRVYLAMGLDATYIMGVDVTYLSVFECFSPGVLENNFEIFRAKWETELTAPPQGVTDE